MLGQLLIVYTPKRENNSMRENQAPESTQLVSRGELDKALAKMLEREKQIAQDLQTALEHISDPDIHKGLEKRLLEGLAHIKALEAGFIPVDRGWFLRTDAKGKWNKRIVQEAVNTMPAHVKDAWDRIETLGIFKSFSITPGRRGDPILVGNAGKEAFSYRSLGQP